MTNLDPHTLYGITIAAVTAIGRGPFAELILARTEQAGMFVNILSSHHYHIMSLAPGGSPRNLRVFSLNSTSIQLAWDSPSPDDHNGLIQEYHINITQAISGVTIQEISNQTHIVITGLNPYTIYHCSVAAVTNDRGPYTDVISVITKEDG